MSTSLSSKFHFLIIFAIAMLLNPIASSSQKDDRAALFIFGDSLVDNGNNNYLKNSNKANFYPYGETFFKYPSGRYSDGRMIPDFIGEHMKLPYLLPYLHPGNYNEYRKGVNFASGGSGALVSTLQGFAIDLPTQVGYLKNVEKKLRQKLGDEESKALLSRAIYLISTGINDYAVLVSANSTQLQLDKYTKNEYVGMVVGNLTTALKEMYKIGGRKFGFINVASIGCVPVMRAINKQIHNSDECFEELEIIAKLHNNALSKALEKLERELKGFKYSNFDFYTLGNDMINNPSKYGFKEGKEGCCGRGPYKGISGSCGGIGEIKEYELCENPSDYLFFDGIHPTESFSKQIAKAMWRGNYTITSPYNLKELLAA